VVLFGIPEISAVELADLASSKAQFLGNVLVILEIIFCVFCTYSCFNSCAKNQFENPFIFARVITNSTLLVYQEGKPTPSHFLVILKDFFGGFWMYH
jgi:hypothetical protein